MLRNVRKNAIQPDMTKISFMGYTSQNGSPAILIFGPFGSCRISTAELSGWRISHLFAVAEESVLRVRAIPQQGSGSRSSPEIVPVRHWFTGRAKRTSYSIQKLVYRLRFPGLPLLLFKSFATTTPCATGQLFRAWNSENTLAPTEREPSVPITRKSRATPRRNRVRPRFGISVERKPESLTGWDEGTLGMDTDSTPFHVYAYHVAW